MSATERGAPAQSATADREIVISRLIGAPRELVFEAFTEVRHLSRWWGPDGFTTTTRAFEFRVGGEWDFVMHGPDGTDYQEWVSWTEIAPPERIAMLHGESRGDPNAFESVLTFAPDGAATRIGMRTVFPTKELRDEAVEKYHAIEGGQQTLSNLAAYVTETNLPGLVRFARGKVRDIYAVGDDQLLIVSTDRVSAFDVVMPQPIPDRGKVLTKLSTFWFRQSGDIVPNHLIADDLASFPESVRGQADVLEGRSMLVRRTKRIDVECVARGYLSGSAWSEYKKQGTVCGIALPAGLVESQELPEPIFTPATKADIGHDENISFERLVEIVGAPLAEKLRDVTLAVYSYAAKVAREKGIIIADTKLEFGLLGDELILIDELLTPDSSRFWDAAAYQPGKTPASFDKQYLRNWLDQSDWDKEPPAPELPADVVSNTRARYVEALERLTGKGL